MDHIGHLGRRLADVREAVELLQHPALAVNLDTSNYALNGQDVVGAIRALRPWIRYAHLKDVHDTPQGPAMTWPGNGYLPFTEIFAELDAVGTDFPVCFEFRGDGDPVGHLRATLEFAVGIRGGEQTSALTGTNGNRR
ncbi:MAG: sugar phosphate isomerase/epimerase [Chloroflexi bacterium]|nr:sugar phosphate isomerase/epimerase [Chloroflexota bacterium]